MRVLNLGSMNVDYVYSVPHIIIPGETLATGGRNTFAGGKGLNQSIAMAKAGLPVYHAGITGNGGEMLVETLQQNHVDTSARWFIRSSKWIKTGKTVFYYLAAATSV